MTTSKAGPLDITFSAVMGRVRTGDTWTCVQLTDSAEIDTYVLVEVIGYPRSIEVKRDIYQAMVKHLATVGVDPADTKITYHDDSPDCWGVTGVQAGSDLAAAQAREGEGFVQRWEVLTRCSPGTHFSRGCQGRTSAVAD